MTELSSADEKWIQLLAARIVVDVCELERDSPEGDPMACVVYAPELTGIVERRVSEALSLRQSHSTGVVVKGLEWEDCTDGDMGHLADTIVGRYVIEQDRLARKSFQLRLETVRYGSEENLTLCEGLRSLGEAKAAAQADYERRILSAIDHVPAQGGLDAEAAVEALFADLRDRSFLKWLFKEEEGVIGDFPALRSIDLVVQQEIRDAWKRILSALSPVHKDGEAVDDADEAYEIGKRDGYEEAVQDIDILTGGDGEYRYCTDHDPDRHTPDAEAMKQRIVDRFNPPKEAEVTDSDLLAAMKEYVGWELDWGPEDRHDEESDFGWRVFECSGGRSDLEWTLLGFGETPRAALVAALSRKG